jgi:hypothetical protein
LNQEIPTLVGIFFVMQQLCGYIGYTLSLRRCPLAALLKLIFKKAVKQPPGRDLPCALRGNVT